MEGRLYTLPWNHKSTPAFGGREGILIYPLTEDVGSSRASRKRKALEDIQNSKFHLSFLLIASRSILNYPTVFLIFILVKIYYYWDSFAMLVQELGEACSNQCLIQVRLLSAMAKLSEIILRKAKVVLVTVLVMTLNIIEKLMNMVCVLTEKVVKYYGNGICKSISCIQEIANPDILDAVNGFSVPKVSFEALRNDLELKLTDPVNLYQPFEKSASSDFHCPIDVYEMERWNTFMGWLGLSIILSIVAVIIVLNIYYIWKCWRKQRRAESILKSHYASRTPNSIENEQQLHRQLQNPFKYRLLRCFINLFCGSDESKRRFERFLIFISHKPSWICMMIGFSGFLLAFGQLMFIYHFNFQMIKSLANLVFFASKQLVALLYLVTKPAFEELAHLYENFKDELRLKIPLDFWDMSFISMDKIYDYLKWLKVSNLADPLSLMMTGIGTLLEKIGTNIPLGPFAKCMFDLSSFKDLKETLSNFITALPNFYNLNAEHLSLPETFYETLLNNVQATKAFFQPILDKMIGSLLREITMYLVFFIYGTLIIWQGILYFYILKIK